MKIIQVAPRFAPFVGGDSEHVRMISKKLVERGHNVVVYTTTNVEAGDVFRISLTFPFFHVPQKKSTIKRKEIIDGITVKRFKPMIQISYGLFTPSLFLELIKEDADIIHAHIYGSSEAYFAGIVSLIRGIPIVWTAHGGLKVASEINGWVKTIKRCYDASFGRCMVWLSRKVVALTEDNVFDYLRIGAKRDNIIVIPNGVNLEDFENVKCKTDTNDIRKRYKLDGPVILFVGRLEKHKGIPYLLNASRLVLNDYPNAKFLIVGKGSCQEEFKTLSKNLCVDSNIVFTGSVSREELLVLYSISDIFVLPSRHEGFGIVILEAMASNLPVVCFRVSAMQYVVQDYVNGILIEPFSDYHLSCVIKQLIDDKGLRKKFGDNARRIVEERYTWKIVVDKIEDMYKDVIGDVGNRVGNETISKIEDNNDVSSARWLI